MKQTISVLVENQAGVLNRITNLFSRRAFNIESLAVGVTDDPSISRITIIVDSGNEQLHREIEGFPVAGKMFAAGEPDDTQMKGLGVGVAAMKEVVEVSVIQLRHSAVEKGGYICLAEQEALALAMTAGVGCKRDEAAVGRKRHKGRVKHGDPPIRFEMYGKCIIYYNIPVHFTVMSRGGHWSRPLRLY